ncbi:hypothetical protein COCMIDRAFT_26222 [Bipolaris oryzae ATCC 44560]|uniref:Uncharacterized protein n=1 Tax=Bipolaris oryzae ATCC 44560 TaxID=930090 RepID=W6Z7F1_COCMI|nr:uncharacterized protein COCMIDRAFT_26222 [Bipolaris oryzae ATCC 44560]EUC45673.1 hypothetical protein COCMIDRAFT_26222 [Bipolaris oryzae ATCC 44560]
MPHRYCLAQPLLSPPTARLTVAARLHSTLLLHPITSSSNVCPSSPSTTCASAPTPRARLRLRLRLRPRPSSRLNGPWPSILSIRSPSAACQPPRRALLCASLLRLSAGIAAKAESWVTFCNHGGGAIASRHVPDTSPIGG